MRIAVLTSSYPRFKGDGTAPFVRSISEALVQRGHMVYVVAPYDVAVKDNLQSPVKVTRSGRKNSTSWDTPGHLKPT